MSYFYSQSAPLCVNAGSTSSHLLSWTKERRSSIRSHHEHIITGILSATSAREHRRLVRQ
ncbi:MAG: hypothetical protein ACYTF0_03690 [Planctomycetota bacterium]